MLFKTSDNLDGRSIYNACVEAEWDAADAVEYLLLKVLVVKRHRNINNN